MILALVLAATVQGTVVMDDLPLPGVTVRLGAQSTVTDANGRYAFFDVGDGKHVVEPELVGLGGEPRTITVAGRDVDTGALVMTPVATNCAMTIKFCSDTPPAVRWDEAQCIDRDSEDIAELRARFVSTIAVDERIADAGALLMRGDGSAAVWNELATWAAMALRFAGHGRTMNMRFVAWAREQGAEPRVAQRALQSAFFFVAQDPRGRSLALQALRTKDDDLVFSAIHGLVKQRDDAALPIIERALREPDRTWMLDAIDAEASDAARAMAAKFGPP